MGRDIFKKMKQAKQSKAQKPGSFQHILDIKQIRSHEYYADESHDLRPVLDGIDLDIYLGECWAITGRSYTIGVLLAIIANIAPFESGTAIITEQKMPRRKRIMLPDIFYLGTSEMLYEDMNVLEFISFATQNSTKLDEFSGAGSQKTILDFLVAADLSYISLSQISYLSTEEKILIIMICAYFSENSFVVINMPTMKMIGLLRESFSYIVKKMQEQQQTIIYSTVSDYDLIEASATHIGVIQEGEMIYSGDIQTFKTTYDNVAFVLTARHPGYVYETIIDLLPDYKVSLENDKIVIRDILASDSPDDMDISYLYAQIREAELWVEQVHVNRKSVANAVKELTNDNHLSL